MAEPATAPESAEPILRLRGIARRFGGVHAVQDVDLEVPARERRAILGSNGAGKTTLFNLISAEFPPTTGSVELFGRDVTAEPARRRARMGMSRTFQTSRLFGGLTVEDNVSLAVLGVRRGHLRPVSTRGRRRDARAPSGFDWAPGSSSPRFTRERSLVRNQPRPSEEAPLSGGFPRRRADHRVGPGGQNQALGAQ
jgi:ABC transporter